MRYSSTVELAEIERWTIRDGFSEPYHKVIFSLISDGIPASQLVVWVHPAYPEDDLVRVARTFAYSRLDALSEAAREDAFSEDEIQALWESVKPNNFMAQ
ncbi:hypothetical protein IQ265_14285 [Nodosilinea sp. LEGE 06152]|uniref:hypothetical protein n=1 Tax=Nodosilinea sp. LEGE 06152 TaxID=2777966 RepID=UPI0018808DB8|nr:hypothetical protein [Nodosilinea sp. LEGE 06152]MBE9157985.1 hypothetical protein [Nodosilinea sp. LEGE 06152]